MLLLREATVGAGQVEGEGVVEASRGDGGEEEEEEEEGEAGGGKMFHPRRWAARRGKAACRMAVMK